MGTKTKKIIGAIIAAIAGVIFALTLTSVFSVLEVQGDTMQPALRERQYTIINKWAYLFWSPEEGDIVAFPCDVYSEDGEGRILMKRVVATAGDTVEIKDGALYINRRIYDEYTAKNVYMEPMKETKIADHKIFVMSDDREAVLDSRDQSIGQIEDTDIIGKVCFK